MRWRWGGLGLLGIAACMAGAPEDEEEESFDACSIDALTGTWRIEYRETNGACGPIPHETSEFDPGSGAGCTRSKWTVSEDQCRLDASFSCPTPDLLGTRAWDLVIEQVSETLLEGTGTAQITHTTLGACRSTYTITATRL